MMTSAAVLAALLLVAAPALGQELHPIAAQVKAELKDPARPFTMVVSLQVKKGDEAKFETAFARAIAATRKEKGCIAYDLNHDLKDPTRYFVYERWSNLSALEAHLRSAHITTLLADLKPLLAGNPEVKVLTPAGE
jgi:quinol monooxygenase YgiN